MGEHTRIEWTDRTFNPWIGCAKVSPGCDNCYAERDFDHRKHVAQWGPNGTRHVTSPANWKQPVKWDREALAAGRPPLPPALVLLPLGTMRECRRPVLFQAMGRMGSRPR